jgi:hypothetical protein
MTISAIILWQQDINTTCGSNILLDLHGKFSLGGVDKMDLNVCDRSVCFRTSIRKSCS